MSNDFQGSLSHNQINSGGTTSNFKLFSSAGSSVDKDTLIDEMQQKIGDLLKCNQEICVLKKENDTLKQQITIIQNKTLSERDNFMIEIEKLKNEIIHRTENENQLVNLNNSLKDTNSKFENQITQYENQISKFYEDAESMTKKFTRQISKLKSEMVQKDDLINNQKIQMKELKTQNSVNSNAFLQQKVEYEKLGEESMDYHNQVNIYQKKNKQLIQEIKKLTSQNSTKESEIASLKEQIESLNQNENKQLEKIKELKKSEANKLGDIARLEEKCTKIISFCRVEDYDGIFDYIKKRRQETKVLKKAMKSSQRIMKEAEEAFQIAIAEKNRKIDEVLKNNRELEQTVMKITEKSQCFEKELETMKAKVSHLEKRDEIGRTISRVNKTMAVRLQNILQIINPEKEQPSLKSIIHASLMLKRWQKLKGRKKKFEKDGRNWWWLETNDGDHHDEIIDLIHKTVQDSEKEKNHSIELEKEREIMKQKISELANHISQIDKEKQEMSLNIQHLTTKTEEQSRVIENKIDKDELIALSTKHSQLKKYTKSLLNEFQQKDTKIFELTNSIRDIQQDHDSTIKDTENTNIELEEVQKANEKLQEELELVYHALNEKNREMFLLERKISKEESDNAVMHSHLTSIAVDNQRLNKSEIINVTKCDDFDLRHRLVVMANNLSGTICD